MASIDKQTAKLIKGCIANERSAQEALFKCYFADMLRLCCRYSKNDEVASEALNTGFLKVFQSIAFYDEHKGDFIVWLRTIMIRTCIDLSRKELKFITEPSNGPAMDNVFVDAEVLHKLYAEDILISIRQLPLATQMVFNLSVIDGYSHKEISEQLKITESTSRWHLSEAKKQLRALLQHRDKGNDLLTDNTDKQ